MALSRYVTTAAVTIAPGTVTAGTFGTGSTTAGSWSPVMPATIPAGTPLVLDPAGELYAAIGAGNLRPFADGQDSYRGGVSN